MSTFKNFLLEIIFKRAKFLVAFDWYHRLKFSKNNYYEGSSSEKNTFKGGKKSEIRFG